MSETGPMEYEGVIVELAGEAIAGMRADACHSCLHPKCVQERQLADDMAMRAHKLCERVSALRQQLADVAYLEAWMRDMRGRPHWDEHSRRFFADGHPEDGADSLPALGARLRAIREEGG